MTLFVSAVWLVVGGAMPLGALAFADEAAINAIFTLAIIGPCKFYTFFSFASFSADHCLLYFTDVAYGIPIACRVFSGDKIFVPGPWYLGRFSKPIAIVALVWMVFACIIFCL